MSTKFSLVPDVCSWVVLALLVVVNILPLLATITTNPLPDVNAFKNASDMSVVTPALTTFQKNPFAVLCNIIDCDVPLII